MRTFKTTSLMLASGLATLAMMQPAMALDAEAFVGRIADVYKTAGYDIEFGAASADGDTVKVQGATVSVKGMEAEPFSFDTELTFTGVTETEDGGFVAEAMTIPDVDIDFAEDPAGSLTLSGIVAENIYLPPAGETGAEILMQNFGRFATGPLSVSVGDAEVFSIDSIEMASEFSYDDSDALTDIVTNTAISGIWANIDFVGQMMPEASAAIAMLGISELNGDITQTMNWSMADGHVVVDDFLIDFDDIGAITFKADLSGFTPAMLDKIYAMQASDVDPMSEEGQAQEMVMGMELLQAISITSASVRYDDASLANKLLDLFAAQSGAERPAFVKTLQTLLPTVLDQYGIPALTEKVAPALDAFLGNPQSLEVAVKPASPTTLLVLSSAASNPAGLISALGLTVVANQ